MFEGRQPVLFQRDGSGNVLIIAPRNNEVYAILRNLARDHVFDISRYQDMLVIEQGYAWDKIKAASFRPDDFHFNGGVKKVMTSLRASHEDVCLSCPRPESECGGHFETIPEYSNGEIKKTNIDSLKEATATHGGKCLLLAPRAVAHVNGSIHKRHVRALGLEPLSSVRVFLDGGNLNEVDHERLVDIASKVDLGDYQGVVAADEYGTIGGVMTAGWGSSQFSYKMEPKSTVLEDIEFTPELVELNAMAAKVRGGHAKWKKDGYKRYRQENCERCVFDCDLPPWDMDFPRPLTRESVVSEYAPNADDRAWMALFTITGLRGRFVSEETGRRRNGIGYRPGLMPGGGWGIEIKALSPPFDSIATIPVSTYWQEARDGMHKDIVHKYDDVMPVLGDGVSDDDLALAHWALRSICEETKWGETKFDVCDRMTRNDILSIGMNGICTRIDIGSDTRATTYGGMFSRGGRRITAEYRPRFSTGYLLPFFDSIKSWLSITPGACRGRNKK